MTRVFIMAQGRQNRLASLKYRKQLLEVGGEPILGRTLRLLRQYTAIPDVVCWPDMFEFVQEHGANPFFLEDPGYCILDGLDGIRECFGAKHLSASPVAKQPEQRTLILLGDVVYSKATLDRIWNDRRPIVFSITPNLDRGEGEIFSLSFYEPHNELIRMLLTDAPCRKAIVNKEQPGHLRNLLWAVVRALDLPKPPEKPRAMWSHEACLIVDDWTNDIDTTVDVAELIPKLDEHVIKEGQR